jgi:putative membrane protein
MPDQAVKSTTTLDTSTRLALERDRDAYDRALLAWIRTATSLIAIGFGVYKFFQLEPGRGWLDNRLIGPREFSLLMVGAGLVLLMFATLGHRQNMLAMRVHYPKMRRSGAGVVAASILALGILTMIAVIFRQ